jgi:hypothetical protein
MLSGTLGDEAVSLVWWAARILARTATVARNESGALLDGDFVPGTVAGANLHLICTRIPIAL